MLSSSSHFLHKTIVLTGSGIRSTMHQWGSLMLKYYGTERMKDRTLKYLGYFTDNGAYYDAGYWPASKGTKDANAVFKNLSNYYATHSVPIKYIQLDDWVGGTCLASATCAMSYIIILHLPLVVHWRERLSRRHGHLHSKICAQSGADRQQHFPFS